MGTSGGNHDPCLDIGGHVTRTFEGSGASDTRTRRTVPRLAHVIDGPALGRASRRQRSEAAGGVDGVTTEPYGPALEANLQDLRARVKAPRYRHQPIRRVPITKAQGQTRPMGMSAFEDTVVQDAVREVLEAIYAPDF